MAVALKIGWLTIDSKDPKKIGEWWKEALGTRAGNARIEPTTLCDVVLSTYIYVIVMLCSICNRDVLFRF